ncbi:signal peptidase I T [Andreesenia angusta]|uniref:Signal peptidase I n=1 Tax=Andreesenia angusta TaxID=39480 RepID=A0A1S1V8T4_9FIRM|nr:signal peptidase I [Andreesenia angusta]OHW62547.1 signal peptidase I T [Andreesenia angusta]
MNSGKFRSELWDWVKSILVAVVIALVIKTFLFNSTKVIGSSMYPTLHENDRLFTNKIVYIVGEPEVGDVVVLQAPDDETKDYIKRVIAVEGDTVDINDGIVYVNGEAIEEGYIAENSYTDAYDQNHWEIPAGQVFVLGDNREFRASKDSRSLGTVDEELVKGKASFRYFPFDRIGTI